VSSSPGGQVSSVGQPVESHEQAPPHLVLTKLYPPTARSQWIVRERLLELLRSEPGTRLTAVIAPAGSGKTTLLGTWLEIETARRPVGWVSVDEGDNDPVVLWSHVFEALRRVCPTLEHVRTPERVGPGHIVDAFLPDLVNALTEQGDAALVLDDFHRILSGPSRESVVWLVEHSPPSFQLVVATRTEPHLPLAALRAHGELLELRAEDLGFTDHEAQIFLNERLELDLDRGHVAELVERTDGWPAGLYLAALSLRGARDREGFVNSFGGGSRHVVDFLIDEVLEAHDVTQQTLMLRCSVLERLCGPLCDALLEQEGSAEQLGELTRTNLFLRPLDDHGQWYRFHHLFAQLLRVELEHREPGIASTLHRRAYAWHRDHGSIDEAVEHALDAGAFAEAGELIAARWPEYSNSGRYATVLAWLERFPSELKESNAVLLLVEAWVLSLCARREEADEAIAAVERLDRREQGALPDGFSSLEASVATLRACMPWGDVGFGLENARRATELEGSRSPFRPVTCWAMGMGLYFSGRLDEADRWFAECVDLAPLSEMWIVAASSLAHRSLIAGDENRPDEQRVLAERAVELARERGVDVIDGEVPTALASSLAAHGDLEEARPLLEHGVEVLRAYGQPIDLAHVFIRQARVLRALGDPEAATTAIAEARAAVDSCPDPGVLEDWLVALERPRDRSANGGGELSERELTVLRALTGPLSERDIARELFLSHNTVHFHTKSVYRKLGVSSRAEAVRRARDLGLL
jgi:LuxR family transcriptional regulator, maltose regulon positive regulatory protein